MNFEFDQDLEQRPGPICMMFVYLMKDYEPDTEHTADILVLI